MPDLGLILRGMKQCPHFKFESSSQTSQLIHPVLSTRQFFSLCNSTFYTQNPVQSCGASILLLPRFKDLQKQFQKKHTTCNLIFIFPTLQDRHISSFHGAPKDSSTSSKAEAPPVSFRPGSLSISLPSMSHVLHVTKDSKKAQQQRVSQRKDTSPLTAPAWVYEACAWSASWAQSPSSPTLALCKGGRSDNSCCHLLVVSAHAHQASPGRTAPLAARRKRRVWLEQQDKHFSITCASPSRAPLPVVLPVIKRNFQPAAEWCTVINTATRSPGKDVGALLSNDIYECRIPQTRAVPTLLSISTIYTEIRKLKWYFTLNGLSKTCEVLLSVPFTTQTPVTEQQMVRNTPLEYSGDSTWICAQII